MRIYRIEDSAGLGPYFGPYWINIEGTYNSDRHPVPYSDVPGWELLKNHKSYRCGFNSIQQMIEWFDGGFGSIDDNGLGISIYESNNVLSGTKQVMFIGELQERMTVSDFTSTFKVV